jgi:hypothetical protein
MLYFYGDLASPGAGYKKRPSAKIDGSRSRALRGATGVKNGVKSSGFWQPLSQDVALCDKIPLLCCLFGIGSLRHLIGHPSPSPPSSPLSMAIKASIPSPSLGCCAISTLSVYFASSSCNLIVISLNSRRLLRHLSPLLDAPNHLVSDILAANLGPLLILLQSIPFGLTSCTYSLTPQFHLLRRWQGPSG